MASSTVTPPQPERSPQPNTVFRGLRGRRSPAEFAAAVRRAAREIGERVSCDARYIGRVESGEIRCPNYAYERVFLHMFPGRSLTDLGFASRSSVRGRRMREYGGQPGSYGAPNPLITQDDYEESDVLRRAFMTGGGATVAAASLGPMGLTREAAAVPRARRPGSSDVGALEEAVRRIRVLDDRHGADGLYQRAAAPLRAAYALLDAGATRQRTADRLYSGAGELAISVGWLAHDSGRFDDARSHYAEALATARTNGDAGLEAHAFCNTAFLARDTGRPREAVRAAQAAQRAADRLGSPRLLSLLALREAGGWAGLGDRTACAQALARARALHARGPSDDDPEWMTFYGEAELEALEAQCWSAMGDWSRAARHARRAADPQDPHFARNAALYAAELADDLARGGRPDEAAAAGTRVLDLSDQVQSARVRAILDGTARVLAPHRRASGVSAFLERHAALTRST
ncbi:MULTISPECIES: hypothetical protein [unclassified Streptomyces]|uniref:hypothetical protein n=1 Tax=unclassified Streptomyces TaxID=2593676 RepID=UPI0019061B29|nr:hypothetical protein [Streptomyces sp. HSG2]